MLTHFLLSDEEMDMLYFLKHIPPTSSNASASTLNAPEEDEGEIDIYHFLHTSEPPRAPPPLHPLTSDTGM